MTSYATNALTTGVGSDNMGERRTSVQVKLANIIIWFAENIFHYSDILFRILPRICTSTKYLPSLSGNLKMKFDACPL